MIRGESKYGRESPIFKVGHQRCYFGLTDNTVYISDHQCHRARDDGSPRDWHAITGVCFTCVRHNDNCHAKWWYWHQQILNWVIRVILSQCYEMRWSTTAPNYVIGTKSDWVFTWWYRQFPRALAVNAAWLSKTHPRRLLAPCGRHAVPVIITAEKQLIYQALTAVLESRTELCREVNYRVFFKTLYVILKLV